jgi:sigma-E factor negative regulatory protein RseC
MMTETGTVIALEDGAVWVQTQRRGTCGACAARAGCGHALLAGAGGGEQIVRALRGKDTPTNIALHDEVRISLPERSFLRGVLYAYLLPIAATLLLALLAHEWFVTPDLAQSTADLRVLAGAAVGLAAGLAGLRWFGARGAADPTLHPVVCARLGDLVDKPVTSASLIGEET